MQAQRGELGGVGPVHQVVVLLMSRVGPQHVQAERQRLVPTN